MSHISPARSISALSTAANFGRSVVVLLAALVVGGLTPDFDTGPSSERRKRPRSANDNDNDSPRSVIVTVETPAGHPVPNRRGAGVVPRLVISPSEDAPSVVEKWLAACGLHPGSVALFDGPERLTDDSLRQRVADRRRHGRGQAVLELILVTLVVTGEFEAVPSCATLVGQKVYFVGQLRVGTRDEIRVYCRDLGTKRVDLVPVYGIGHEQPGLLGRVMAIAVSPVRRQLFLATFSSVYVFYFQEDGAIRLLHRFSCEDNGVRFKGLYVTPCGRALMNSGGEFFVFKKFEVVDGERSREDGEVGDPLVLGGDDNYTPGDCHFEFGPNGGDHSMNSDGVSSISFQGYGSLAAGSAYRGTLSVYPPTHPTTCEATSGARGRLPPSPPHGHRIALIFGDLKLIIFTARTGRGHFCFQVREFDDDSYSTDPLRSFPTISGANTVSECHARIVSETQFLFVHGNAVQLGDITTGTWLWRRVFRYSDVLSVAVSRDDRVLVTTSSSVAVVRLRTGKC